MYCLDTNFLISFLKGDMNTLEKYDELSQSFVAVTSISAAELFEGAFLYKDQEEIKRVESLLRSFEILPFDLAAAKKFGELNRNLRQIGKPTELRDHLIASIVLVHGLTLITQNKKDFENIKGLKIEAW